MNERSTAGTNEIDIVQDEEAKSDDSIDRLMHKTEELEVDLQDLLGEESERPESNHRARMTQPNERQPLLDSAPSESYGLEVSEKLKMVNWFIRDIKERNGTGLILNDKNIGPEGAIAIANALKDDKALKIIDTLALGGNNIGDKGAIAIADAIKDNNTIKGLWLNENNIGEEGAVAVADALKDNNTITQLYLKDNNIGDNGAIALAIALKDNTALCKLFLESNSIGDEGAIAIANALKDNTTLKWLDLNKNEIGGEGASALASALKYNETHTTLNANRALNIESLKRASPRFWDIPNPNSPLLDPDFESTFYCARTCDPFAPTLNTFNPVPIKTAGNDSSIEVETSSSNKKKDTHILTVKERTISESISKEATKLRGTELFKQQCHFSLAKHRLAAMHLASLQFWIFTIPTALIAMASGTMAFLATAGIFEERTDNILNVFVGCFSFLVVFLQTLSSQLKYDTRAEMHESTAIDLRDLREDLENIENQTFVMVGHRVNEDKLNAMKKKNKGNGDGSADENDGNGNKTNGNNEEDSLNQIFDGIQKRYNQCLKSCKSTIPLPINTAFSQLDSRINSTLSIVGHNQLERVYGYGYNNVIYFQACDELALHFSCAFLWPLRLVNPREAVVTTMKNLRTTISEDGKNYWTVLLEKDDATENADSSSSSDGCW